MERENKNKRKFSTPIIITFLLLAFFAGILVGNNKVFANKISLLATSIIPASEPKDVDFSPVWRVWDVINQKFVPTPKTPTSTVEEMVGNQEKVWGMAQGLAASLGDPYTVFFPPEENEMFQSDISGSFEGVGMEIAIRDGILTVVAPLKDTPAYKAGIKAKDRIIKIDGKSTEGISINTAVKLIRGERGTKVLLTIIREGEKKPLEISVTRDKIDIPTLEVKKKNGVFIIELMSFTATSPSLFKNAIEEFAKSGYSKLIIDLRGNPGGYLSAAVDIASYFLPQGDVVVTENYAGKAQNIVHRSRGFQLLKNKKFKVVVLVDKGSASASEILAGALRDYGKATLIGTNTFGKGSVQELVDITKDTALKVTVARWILPKGAFIGGEGLSPDLEVKPTDEQIKRFKNDPDYDIFLSEAIKYLNK